MALFKYTSRYGVNIIRDLQLKVTPPNELNDPFEFSPYMAGTVTKEHIQELRKSIPARAVYDEMARNNEPMPSYEQFEKLHALLAPALPDTTEIFQKHYEELISDQLDSVSKRMGLICFSEEENNILLWSHYTVDHKGMLFEFDTSHGYFKLNSKFMKVKYSEKRIPFDPNWPDNSKELEQYAENVLLTKNIDWSYENEWRSLFPLDWCHKKLNGTQTLYFTDIPPEIIQRVVLGYRCPLDVQQQVVEEKNRRNLGFRLERACLHRSEFRVEYRQI